MQTIMDTIMIAAIEPGHGSRKYGLPQTRTALMTARFMIMDIEYYDNPRYDVTKKLDETN